MVQVFFSCFGEMFLTISVFMCDDTDVYNIKVLVIFAHLSSCAETSVHMDPQDGKKEIRLKFHQKRKLGERRKLHVLII